MANAVETYYEGGTWKNRVQGQSRALGTYNNKDAAVQAGRQLAIERKAEHIIKNMDGTIAYRNSYGNDPYPPPG